jgi:integrase
MTDKIKLTDSVVAGAAVAEGQAERVIWDSEVTGFGLRVRAQSKTWIVFYRPAGMGRSTPPKRFKLGTPETISTATEARRQARDVLGRVARGEDPAAERSERRRAAKARVRDLINAYEAHEKARGRANVGTVVSVIRRGLQPFLDRDVRDVTAVELVGVIDRLAAKGQAGAAADFRARCRAFLSWCRDSRKVLTANPLQENRRERPTRVQKLKREEPGRALNADEIQAVWKATGTAAVYHRLVRFILLTGCRRTEASLVSRAMQEQKPDGPRWFAIPKAITKSGRDHRLPVTPQLAELLDACPRDARSDLFFASTRTGGPVKGWSKLHATLVKDCGVAFGLHDLRRTLKTGLDALGVDSDISEICLNHTRHGLEGIYNRNSAAGEVSAAFHLWGNFVAPAPASGAEREQANQLGGHGNG